MPLEVDYITLGDASTKINVPAPTLRHWTDQMEEFNVHFVLRNNRNERIYEESDIKVFEFLRDLKDEHGRRTTTKDLGYMIAERGKSGELQLRSKIDMPTQSPSNKTADLLNQEDIKRLMDSERVKQFIGIVIAENTKNLRDELINEVKDTVREEVKTEMTENLQKIEEMNKRIEERQIARDENITKLLRESIERKNEEKKSFFARLFGK